MEIPLKRLTLRDIEIYKQYQEWYYHDYYRQKYNKTIVNDFQIGDVVKISNYKLIDNTGIVMGLSGQSHYVYVMAYDKRAERYWSFGCEEINLSKLDQAITKDKPLYEAFKDWLLRNDFSLCTDNFKEMYYKHIKENKSNIVYIY